MLMLVFMYYVIRTFEYKKIVLVFFVLSGLSAIPLAIPLLLVQFIFVLISPFGVVAIFFFKDVNRNKSFDFCAVFDNHSMQLFVMLYAFPHTVCNCNIFIT